MDERFRRAVDVVLKHEGGLSEHPSDPSGITHWGISLRSYPELGEEGIRNLTKEQAAEIYYRDFYAKYGYARINDEAVATKVFDMAVNMGPATAHRLLQEALVFLGFPVDVDGILGPQTLMAVNRADPKRLLQVLRWRAAERYFHIAEHRPQMRAFLIGWLRRAYS